MKNLRVALVREVFFQPGWEERLFQVLEEARSRGAELALLPELPCNPWSPATRQVRGEDAEPPGGARQQAQAEVARRVGIGLVGGAVIREPEGERYNTALVFDATGRQLARYCKMHVPEEEGFWETAHYASGRELSPLVEEFGFPFGIQICSDIQRPQGSAILAALGAGAILAPRATEEATYPRWRTVFQANAITGACYVLSVGRPRPEQGVALGGPAVAVAPDGALLLESLDPVAVVELEGEALRRARTAYPGYLPVRAGIYARGWAEVARLGRDGAGS